MTLLDVTAITGQEENTDQCLQEPRRLQRMCHGVSGWASGLYGVFTGKYTQHPIPEPGATDYVTPVYLCMRYIIRGHPVAEEDNEEPGSSSRGDGGSRGQVSTGGGYSCKVSVP